MPHRLLTLLGMATILLLGCRPTTDHGAPAPEIQFRPIDAPSEGAPAWLVQRIPNAVWDKGLARATSNLTAAARDRRAALTPLSTSIATNQVGYPGQAHFLRELNGGAFPEKLADTLTQAALTRPQQVDVALSWREFGDGTTLWIGAFAHRPASLDPIPRDLRLDEALPVRFDLMDGAIDETHTLFLAPPNGTVQTHPLEPASTLWLQGFHVPGPYRIELVSHDDEGDAQVALLFSVYVEDTPPDLPSLPRATADPADPVAATDALYRSVAELRSNAGLPPLERFPLFEPIAREHAAHMGHSGVIAHVIPGVTAGVQAHAAARFHPVARHLQDVAAAATWKDGLDLVRLSPGHLANLLCVPCSHIAIGVSLEPVEEGPSRLMMVFEVMEFPNGPPKALEDYER